MERVKHIFDIKVELASVNICNKTGYNKSDLVCDKIYDLLSPIQELVEHMFFALKQKI